MCSPCSRRYPESSHNSYSSLVSAQKTPTRARTLATVRSATTVPAVAEVAAHPAPSVTAAVRSDTLRASALRRPAAAAAAVEATTLPLAVDRKRPGRWSFSV
jgi:hypothetical protein